MTSEEAPRTWGGRRPGAGRKPTRQGPRLRRVRKRPALSGHEPVHVVLQVLPVVGDLRRPAAYQALRGALIGALLRGTMRVVHAGIQSDHLHLLVEVDDERALTRGVQGFQIAAARRLNAALAAERGERPRRGKVFADRYHAVALDSPRRVRNCLALVLNHPRAAGGDVGLDPCATGLAFDGWRDHPTPFALPADYPPIPVARPRTWLLTTGWRQHGRLALGEHPPAGVDDPVDCGFVE